MTPADPDGKSDYGNPYLFTGRRVDFLDDGSLTLQYNRHRYYDYYTGRWTTEDPVGYVDGMNLYQFVASNPATNTDPLGLGTYSVGTSLPPPAAHDPGAGAHGAEAPPTLRDFFYHLIWWNIATHTTVNIGLPDAARHMRHYLMNSGDTLDVRVSNMVDDSPQAKAHFYSELNDAMEFVEDTVECGKSMSIVGTWTGGQNSKRSSKNWFFAVGGYNACGSGKAEIICAKTGELKYKLKFEFHFDDRYNWDTGKGVNIIGIRISDSSLGRLHKVGIAQEFDMTGKATKSVTWQKGQRFDIMSGALRGSGGAGGRRARGG